MNKPLKEIYENTIKQVNKMNKTVQELNSSTELGIIKQFYRNRNNRENTKLREFWRWKTKGRDWELQIQKSPAE